MKTIEELKKLNTKRLLSYYKAERKRYKVSISEYYYGFDNVEFMWDIKLGYEKEQIKYNDWNRYLNLIKEELSKRENIN